MKKPKQLKHFKKPQITAALFAVIFAGIGVYILAFTHAATVATLKLSPASSTVGIGNNFTVTVVEDSGTDTTNAVQADLTFNPSQLQYVSEDTATSSSAFDIQVPAKTGSGTVSVARGATTARTGQQNVAVLTFKALTGGNAAVNFAGTSAIVNVSTHQDILGGVGNTTGGTYNATDQTAPSAPTGVASSAVTATSVTLNWTASTDNVGVTGYNVYRNGTLLGTSPTTTTTNYTNNSGLSPSTAYSYTVKAIDGTGQLSSASTALNVTTTADTAAPGTPTNVSVTTKTTTSVALSWTAPIDNVGVTGYNVYRDGTLIGTSPTTTTTSYTNTGLTAGTTYLYTIEARDAANNKSAKTTALSVTTNSAPAETTPPSVPTGLDAGTTRSNTSIPLTWTASTDNVGVTGYNILRNGTKVGTSTTTSYTDTGLTANTTYTYTVQAFDAAGNTSASSSSLSVKAIKDGDTNGDGKIGITDLSALADNYGKSSGATRAQGDFNGDGKVNVIDLSILADNWAP